MSDMVRHNSSKPQMSYLPSSFFRALTGHRSEDLNIGLIEDIARVLEFGAKKYSKDNWRASGSWCKCADSALRHLIAYMAGDVVDPESGLPHLAHLGCNLTFLIEFQAHGTGRDDRYKRPTGQTVVPLLDKDTETIVILLDYLTRWLEGYDNDLLPAALCLLSDIYAEEETLNPEEGDDE